MSAINKIVVRNVGVLKAFATPNAPQLAKLTQFYARNGRGKTTLSSVLRAASMGRADVLHGRRTFGTDPTVVQVTLVYTNGSISFASGRWTPRPAPIEVFDAGFIAENLFAGESVGLSHDRKLFSVILGAAGVRLARQQEYFVAAAKIVAARLKLAEAALANDIPTDQSREEFFASMPPVNIDQQIAQAQKDLKAVQQSDRLTKLKSLTKLVIPEITVDVEGTLERTLQTVEEASRGRLAIHFKRFELGRQGEGWVKFGLEHIHDDTCPFCGKDEVDGKGLVTLYNQIFGETYKAHFDAIREAGESIEGSIGAQPQWACTTLCTTNAEALISWAEFITLESATLPNIDTAIESLKAAHTLFKNLFDAKRDTPLSAITRPEEIAQARASLVEAVAAITAYNQAVDAAQTAITTRLSQTATPEAQSILRVANLIKRKNRTDPGVQSRIDGVLRAKRQDERAKRTRTTVQNRLKQANNDAADHYYTKVNDYLSKFDASFRISQFTNSMTGNAGSVDYGLIVRGHEVPRGREETATNVPSFRNTLSTGDKTTLAFAFFLAGLDRLPDLTDRVIVFDDPMSSHDTHRQAKTVELLKGLCARSAQMIVLSHDEHFLRQVKRHCVGTPDVCYKIEGEGADNWSKADIADLDKLCQSDHAKQLAKLHAFFENRTGDASDVAPAVRKVLETHFRGAYTAYFEPDDNLGPIIRKIRAHGFRHPCWDIVEALDACNNATMNEHHGNDPSVVPSGPIDPDNLRTVVRDCLELINARLPQPAAIA
ncbi:AAA family ATPase [Tardiphaga sp. vice352]|uniref:AAA family ATPase n=1 Tax=Tardiphaga sp. vice352 TaxID=2592816 RepID=UPI0011642B94|nr:AAA family ATPase [Tardiphaga sp. vice352]QDM32864.1 AAA family ATPase [Tardiphaga sp. vice352]